MWPENWQLKTYSMESYDGVKLHTEVYLPDTKGRYPVICIRDPYVLPPEDTDEYRKTKFDLHRHRLEQGFAVVHQHCRGYGGSEGRAAPFVYERRDGLILLSWIQKQDWYGDGIYLEGGSYTGYVELAVLDALPDAVKAASIAVFSSHAYEVSYLNGEYKLHIGPIWYPTVLKNEELLSSVENSFDVKHVQKFYHAAIIQHPFYKFVKRLYGHDVPEFSDWFFCSGNDDEFARRKNGIGDARDAMRKAKIPILLRGGWFEPFFNGMVPMWDELPEETRGKSCFLVGPWTHSTTLKNVEACPFFGENGEIEESTAVAWFRHIRDGAEFPYAQEGNISAYIVGEDRWENHAAFRLDEAEPLRLYPSQDSRLTTERPEESEISYRYNPLDPPEFSGGQNAFSTVSDGAALQPQPNFRPDVKSFSTEPLTKDLKMRGPTKIHFAVKSDCDDTAFLVRVLGVTRSGEAWVLQETITTLSFAAGNYDPNTTAEFELVTDPLFWTLKQGERIRVDIASANGSSYWPHSNTKGQWATRSTTRIATNTLFIGKFYLEFPAVELQEGSF
ncbi:MAG: CocE/NonD family hydrolase [Clostridia bacterium]|nr:CocE/NonD family hydrolase [Clostridia bacterium]